MAYKITSAAAHIANFEIGMASEYLRLGSPDKARPHLRRAMSAVGHRPDPVAIPPGATPDLGVFAAAKIIHATHKTVQQLGSYSVSMANSEVKRLDTALNIAWATINAAPAS